MSETIKQNKMKTKFTFKDSKMEVKIGHFEHVTMNPEYLQQEAENVNLSEKMFMEIRARMRGEAPPMEEREIIKGRQQTEHPVEAAPEKSWKEKQEEKKQKKKNLKRAKKLTDYGDELTADLVEKQKQIEADTERFVDHVYTGETISEQLKETLKTMQSVKITADMFTNENFVKHYVMLRETIEKGNFIVKIAKNVKLMNQLKEQDINLYAAALYWQDMTPALQEMFEFTNIAHGLYGNGSIITFSKEADNKEERGDIIKNPKEVTDMRNRLGFLRKSFGKKMEKISENHWQTMLTQLKREAETEVNQQKMTMIMDSTEEQREWMESPSLIYGTEDAYEDIQNIKGLIESNAPVYLANKKIIDKMYSDIIRRFEILGEVKVRTNAWGEVKYRYRRYENRPRGEMGNRICRHADHEVDQLMKISINTADNLTSIRNALSCLLRGKTPNTLEQAVLETYGYKIADSLLMSDALEQAADMFEEAWQEIAFQEELTGQVAVLEELEEAAVYNSMEKKLFVLNFNQTPKYSLNKKGKQMTGEEKVHFGVNIRPDSKYKVVDRWEKIKTILEKYKDKELYGDTISGSKISNLGNISGSVYVEGLVFKRLLINLSGISGDGWTESELEDMCDDLVAGCRCRTLDLHEQAGSLTEEERQERKTYDDTRVGELDARFDRGMLKLKQIQLAQLRRIKEKYGLYGSQLHPEDFAQRIGLEFFDDFAMDQDFGQMLIYGTKYFDFEHNAEDREFRDLANYYHSVFEIIFAYFNAPPDAIEWVRTEYLPKLKDNEIAKQLEENLQKLGAKGLTKEEETAYRRKIIKENKIKKDKTLFGRFKEGFEDEVALEVAVLEELEETAVKNRMEMKLKGLMFNGNLERTGNMNVKEKIFKGKRSLAPDITLYKGRENLMEVFNEEFTREELYGDYYKNSIPSFANASATASLEYGLVAERMVNSLMGALGGEKTVEELAAVMRKLLCCGRYRQLQKKMETGKDMTPAEQQELEGYTEERIREMDRIFDEGVAELKQLHLENLRRVREKYGRFPSQLHPEDFLERAGLEYFDEISSIQDVAQILVGRYYDANNPADVELNALTDYYRDTNGILLAYVLQTDIDLGGDDFEPDISRFNDILAYQYVPLQEPLVAGPGFTEEEQRAYEKSLLERKPDRLFGRFKNSV